jgi:hypothetical protein
VNCTLYQLTSGVLYVSCQSAIVEIIRGFDETITAAAATPPLGMEPAAADARALQSTSTRNSAATNQPAAKAPGYPTFLNVTGGSLPRPDTTNIGDDDERLGNDECRPVLAQSYSLYKVADMRLYYVNPSEMETSSTAMFLGAVLGLRPL